MFMKFSTAEERQRFGGSAFLEIQYCIRPTGTPLKRLVRIGALKHWDNTSLYVHADDLNAFYFAYKDILSDGVYHNLQHGTVDPYGINYYSLERAKEICCRIVELEPAEGAVLLQWLMDSKNKNGFYILGV